MARRKTDITDPILQTSPPAVLLYGPAGAGKTAIALEIYRKSMDEIGQSCCLLLAPNVPAANALKRQLLEASSSGVLICPQVSTFNALAGRILAACGDTGRSLSHLERHLLLRQIVNELNGQNRLSIFHRIADTPGLITALDRSIMELKQNAIEPEQFAQAIINTSDKNRDLLEVYRRYQEILLEKKLYDLEGRMWQARNLLAQTPRSDPSVPGLEGILRIVADGFTDFTPTQLELLHHLSERIEKVVITLAYDEDNRPRLWRWTHRTRQRIRKQFGQNLEEVSLPSQSFPLEPICGSVFDSEPAKCDFPDGIEFIAAAGTETEIAEVAARIKKLLVGGTPAGKIAVLARSMSAYQSQIERIFTRHEIPVSSAPVNLIDVPSIRFLLNVAFLSAEYASRDVLAIISNSYFCPESLGEYTSQDVAAAQVIIREGNVLAGKDAYLRAAKYLLEMTPKENEAKEEETMRIGLHRFHPDQIRSAAAMLEALFGLSEQARGIGGLPGLIEPLALRKTILQIGQPDLIARDLRALSELEGLAGRLDQSSLSLRGLSEVLAITPCPPARNESLVDILDVLDARPLRYEHVFLIGLSEGQFPQRVSDSSLIGENDRATFAARGLQLDRREDLTAREMLLFYLAISRANRRLTISYLESDNSGRFADYSSFLFSLAQPFGGMEHPSLQRRISRIAPGTFLNTSEGFTAANDAFNVAVSEWFSPDSHALPEAFHWAITHQAQRIRRAAAGIYASDRRFRFAPCDAYDGHLSDVSLLEPLADRIPSRMVFSAARLNTYAQCPWCFFGKYLLKLTPLTEPIRRLEATARGEFMHAVLFRVLSRFKQIYGEDFRLGNVDSAALPDILSAAVEEEARPIEEQPPNYPMLWAIQKKEMHNQLLTYLQKELRENPNANPRHLELTFGFQNDTPLHDPSANWPMLDLPAPFGNIRIGGRIDRIDALDGGWMVIDYKTGVLPKKNDIETGLNLQLPIYIEAVSRLTHHHCLGGMFQRITHGSNRKFSESEKPKENAPSFEEQRKQIMEKVVEYVAAIRRGHFDTLPVHNCPSYCPFRRICRYSPARAEFKSPREESVHE